MASFFSYLVDGSAMGSDGDRAREQALESGRRVYDRQADELGSIDDKAMRTARTSVLILGFIAAALTAAGPDALTEIEAGPTIAAGFGSLSLLASAFVSIGIYSVTEYPTEIRDRDLQAAPHTPKRNWIDSAITRVNEANTELEYEIVQNSRFLNWAQVLLLMGVLLLSFATTLSVAKQSYGVNPEQQLSSLARSLVQFCYWKNSLGDQL